MYLMISIITTFPVGLFSCVCVYVLPPRLFPVPQLPTPPYTTGCGRPSREPRSPHDHDKRMRMTAVEQYACFGTWYLSYYRYGGGNVQRDGHRLYYTGMIRTRVSLYCSEILQGVQQQCCCSVTAVLRLRYWDTAVDRKHARMYTFVIYPHLPRDNDHVVGDTHALLSCSLSLKSLTVPCG